jgi:hypothetical protein
MDVQQRSELKIELTLAGKEYGQEARMGREYGYINGKNRVPKKLHLKR